MSTRLDIDPEIAKRMLYKSLEDDKRRWREQEMAEQLRGSLKKFLVGAWPQIEPSKALIPSWHIDAICDHIQAAYEGKIKNLLITVPPGSAKSVIASVAAPAWMWTRNPGFRSTHISYDDALSTRDSVRCRDLMDSIWYRETFRPQWKYATDQNEKTYYVNSFKGFRVSGKGTGWRSHALICDDILNAKDRFSDTILAKVIDDWENVLANRFVSMSEAIRILIMQRLTDRDLAGHWLRKGGCEHLKIPLEYEPSRSKVTSIWEDPRKDSAVPKIMCPEMFPPQVVESLKANEELWNSQYQQEPSAEGGGILKSHAWNYWQSPGAGLPPVRVKMPDGTIQLRAAVDLPDSFDLELQSWDMAVRDLKTSDFNCGIVVGVKGGQRFMRTMVKRKMGIVETMAAVREMTGLYPRAHLKLIENKANGAPVVEMLEKEIPGMTRVNPEDGKVARASACAHEVSAGNWYLPHPAMASWVGNPENPTEGGFLASTVVFPYGANDDDVDAWSQAGVRIQKEHIGGVFGVSEQQIRVEPFDLKLIEKWPKIFGMHVDWREVAAVWLTRQPETGQHYLYAEYSSPATDPAAQAGDIKKIGDFQGYMAPDPPGRELKDGYAVIRKFTQLGVKLEALPDRGDAAVLDCAEALRTGRLKVCANLATLFNQYRMYRRTDTGKLPLNGVGVINAMLIAWRAKDKMRAPVDPTKREIGLPQGLPNSWMTS